MKEGTGGERVGGCEDDDPAMAIGRTLGRRRRDRGRGSAQRSSEGRSEGGVRPYRRREMRDLGTRAREGKLKASEFQGGHVLRSPQISACRGLKGLHRPHQPRAAERDPRAVGRRRNSAQFVKKGEISRCDDHELARLPAIIELDRRLQNVRRNGCRPFKERSHRRKRPAMLGRFLRRCGGRGRYTSLTSFVLRRGRRGGGLLSRPIRGGATRA